MNKKIIKLLLLLCLRSQLIAAESFQHHNWEVVCDNTNICRVAGYSDEMVNNKATVLLTRKAGANESISGEVQIAYYDNNEDMFTNIPDDFNLEMYINDIHYGFVAMHKKDLSSPLSPKQIDALLSSPHASRSIVWKYKAYTWELSDSGLVAVLLRMDTYQKRLNTIGAIYKKGKRSEKYVLAPKVEPIISVQKILNSEKKILSKKEMQLLEESLPFDSEVCYFDEGDDVNITVQTLSENKLLVSRFCWGGGYNSASSFWVINKKTPFHPKLVTNYGTGFYVDSTGIGTISITHKGRGIGDCWSAEEFVWDGKNFPQSLSTTTGLCRGFTGGAWTLPTFVSDVSEFK